MTTYLGICMVVIVTSLCIGVLARLVTHNILDEFDKMRVRRSDRFLKTVVKLLNESGGALEKMVKTLSDLIEKEEKKKQKEKEEFMKKVEEAYTVGDIPKRKTRKTTTTEEKNE